MAVEKKSLHERIVQRDSLVSVNEHSFEEDDIGTIEAALELLKKTERPVNLKIKSSTAPKPKIAFRERQSILEL